MFVPHTLSQPVECEAIVITCLDFRFQPIFEHWLKENLGSGKYDRVAYAGSVKSWDVIFSQIEFARQVHKIETVILINHEDCRAYGEAGTRQRLIADLLQARKAVFNQYPELDVQLYYARLAGYLERVG